MGLFDKMKNVFAPDDDDYYDDDLGMEEDEEQEPLYNPRNNDYSSSGPSYRRRELRADSKVVNINTNIQMQVRIINPVKYEDAQEICDEVKARKPVVVNLEKMEYPTAQRIMDFLSGTCYSLDGTIQKVASNIYIIAPENVSVSGDLKEELKTSGLILPWASQGK
ncbi:cell division protein SepF [Anaerotignum faecicola]|nr:cell division protein SepF [Anaerotignum faecicola]